MEKILTKEEKVYLENTFKDIKNAIIDISFYLPNQLILLLDLSGNICRLDLFVYDFKFEGLWEYYPYTLEELGLFKKEK